MHARSKLSVAARVPVATYRLQLHQGFTLDDAASIVDYLHDLGISDLYCSPIFKARAGSTHGYDIVDPAQINPALGGERALRRMSDQAQAHDMGVLLDIVPNHMAVSSENPAWISVLEFGRLSPFADWFDIDWSREQITLPLLGESLDNTIAHGELQLRLIDGVVVCTYLDRTFPVNGRSYMAILDRLTPAFAPAAEDAHQRSAELYEQARLLPHWKLSTAENPDASTESAAFKRHVAKKLRNDHALRERVERGIESINDSRDALLLLLDQQVYRLCSWKEASRDIAYRRFFDITDLVGIQVEQPKVFQQTHKLVLRLLEQGDITGLRIDHVDGLADPRAYLQRLQYAATTALRDESTGNSPSGVYVLVEKILEGDEELKESWPVSGTTGYEFLNAVSGVFIDHEGLQALGEHYRSVTGDERSMPQLVYELKMRVARDLFGGELAALLRELRHLHQGLSDEAMRDALVELSARLPVYRTYADSGQFDVQDQALLNGALDRLPASPETTCLRDILLARSSASLGRWTQSQQLARQRFITRWQQFTGPLMAKGLEDTALYRDTRLISLNEVGMHPQSTEDPGGIERFHAVMKRRCETWPHSLSTTSTHDTKRGEDARARIHALSDMADEWIKRVDHWMSLNRHLKMMHRQHPVPDVAMELLLYQSALGIWPLLPGNERDVVTRLEAYTVKAAREAKQHTSWINPDDTYERALKSFVRQVFVPDSDSEFMMRFRRFHQQVSWYGAINSLSQTLLKLTAPGVPDVYQGCELWDLTLVDPDNRRPIDFDVRRKMLAAIHSTQPQQYLAEHLAHWRDGRIKLFVTYRALLARSRYRELFDAGDYQALRVQGQHAALLCAFARCFGDHCAIVAVPTCTRSIVEVGCWPMGPDVWADTMIELPSNRRQSWMNWLTAQPVEMQSPKARHLPAAELLREAPVALCVAAKHSASS